MSTEPGTVRVAVITGASSGIAQATGRPLAADGHGVPDQIEKGRRPQ
jgi:NADP-dependent 3-hydroxy acid dehydrogenase YdfG